MNAKDRCDSLSKEGCGRVVMYKVADIIHSYSLECGILSPNNLNTPTEPPNTNFSVNGKGLIEVEPKAGEKLFDGSESFT